MKSGALEIQLDAYRVFLDKKEVPFTRREFGLLAFLAEHPNIVFSRETLFVWGGCAQTEARMTLPDTASISTR